jgi:hypothetical protein
VSIVLHVKVVHADAYSYEPLTSLLQPFGSIRALGNHNTLGKNKACLLTERHKLLGTQDVDSAVCL